MMNSSSLEAQDKSKEAQEDVTVETACCTRFKNRSNLGRDVYGKATQFWLFSCRRPHMRGFQASWFGFFIAFIGWFSVQPLIPYIQEDLNLTKEDVANSAIAGVASVIAVRLIAGPLVDRFGPRRIMATLLVAGAIPLGVVGLTSNVTGLMIIRLFIGTSGATFVPCQFWTICLFSSNIVGSANALAGGWGNLGGGVAFLLMPLLLRLVLLTGMGISNAWKITLVIPATICMISAMFFWFFTDDCPQGPWHKRKKVGALTNIDEVETPNGTTNPAFSSNDDDTIAPTQLDTSTSERPIDTDIKSDFTTSETFTEENEGFRERFVLKIVAIVILFVQYSACFGVEISVNSILNVYLLRKFKEPGCDPDSPQFANSTTTGYECSVLNAETASLITSIFGLMNLFARFTGGFLSDLFARRFSLSGRLMVHFLFLALEGSLMITFGYMETIPSLISVLILWSLCIQSAEGTSYALVPFVWPQRVGVVAGIVAAGGTSGGICWNFLWRYSLDNMSRYFTIVGSIALGSSLFTFLLFVGGYYILDPCLRIGRFNEKDTGYESKFSKHLGNVYENTLHDCSRL